MKDLRHPAKPLHRSEMNSDATLVSEEDSEEEDFHSGDDPEDSMAGLGVVVDCAENFNCLQRVLLQSFRYFATEWMLKRSKTFLSYFLWHHETVQNSYLPFYLFICL